MKPDWLSPAGIGVACALIASLAFTLNDVGIKFLSGDYPLHQVILVRASFGLVITLAIMMPLEGGLGLMKTNRLGRHLVRGALVVTANLLFFLGLSEMPLAEATAIFFVSPLVITVFSVVFLKETVGPWRWFAVFLGLVGAIIMLRPTPETFRIEGLLPMGAAVCYAGLHILTRTMRGTEKASTMSFYIQLCFVITAAIMGLMFGDGKLADQESNAMAFLFRPWVVPLGFDFAVMASVGFASAVGGYFISQAYRLSDAALIAPIEYVALVLSVFWGITIFGEWPDLVAVMGIGLILAGGFLMLWRERVAQKTVTPIAGVEVPPLRRSR